MAKRSIWDRPTPEEVEEIVKAGQRFQKANDDPDARKRKEEIQKQEHAARRQARGPQLAGGLSAETLDAIVRATGLRLVGDHAQLARDLSMAHTWFRVHQRLASGKTPLRRRVQSFSSHARALRTLLADDDLRGRLRQLYEGDPEPREEPPTAARSDARIQITAEVVGRAIFDADNLQNVLLAELPKLSPKEAEFDGSPIDWLAGIELPRIFTEAFGQPATKSRSGGSRELSGTDRALPTPYTRFAQKIFATFGIMRSGHVEYSLETIVRALGRGRQGSVSRNQLRAKQKKRNE
jgi:hypothetical protein